VASKESHTDHEREPVETSETDADDVVEDAASFLIEKREGDSPANEADAPAPPG
jgi:hypothetical protein